MHIEIITIFPGIFEGFLNHGVLRRAIERGLVSITCTDLRQFAEPPHRKVDDAPFGGGAGMVMKPEPLASAVTASRAKHPGTHVVLLAANGGPFTHEAAKSLSACQSLTLVCGRYEGVDQRFIERYVDAELSVGEFVLMGGEVASMAVVEATTRLLPGVLGNSHSASEESFANPSAPALEGPQYTRPAVFEGLAVPEELLSGDHARIASWRREMRERLTTERRRPKARPEC